MSTSPKSLKKFLADNRDNIYAVLGTVKDEMDKIMTFGPINKGKAMSLMAEITPPHDIKALRFPLNMDIKSRELLLSLDDFLRNTSEPSPANHFNYQDAFIHGLGSCEHYSFFALVILSKYFKFNARIENIHSEQVHTYTVLTDARGVEYVLDLWSDIALDYSNDREWNECLPREYHRTGESSISVVAQWNSKWLREIAKTLDSGDLLTQRRAFRKKICADATKSVGNSKEARFFNDTSESTKHKKRTLPLADIHQEEPIKRISPIAVDELEENEKQSDHLIAPACSPSQGLAS